MHPSILSSTNYPKLDMSKLKIVTDSVAINRNNIHKINDIYSFQTTTINPHEYCKLTTRLLPYMARNSCLLDKVVNHLIRKSNNNIPS